MNFDLIQARAELAPDAPALCFNGRWISYGQLNQRAIQMANRLREIGVVPGDRVSVLALNHPVHIDLLLAAPKLGFVFAPLNYRLSSEELRGVVRALRPRFLFVDSRHQALTREVDCPWARLAEYPEWLSVGKLTALPPPTLTPDSLHMILLTGGTTGVPKGAMLPYRQTLGNCRSTVQSWGITAADCAIQATPCFHAALNVLTLPLLSIGGRVVLMPQFEPEEYLELLERDKATLMFLVPTMYQMLTNAFEFEDSRFCSVRWAISGGAPCPPSVRAAFAGRGVRFRQGYGLTEAGVNCFSITADEAAENPEAVGRPIAGLEMQVRHPDGAPVTQGETGELTLRGDQVCAGYWQQPAEWQTVFRDGWLWTGDLARVDAQGLYSLAGRRKDLYISGGENVYPLEVENVLGGCSGVAECAVLGIPDSTWGETGLAAIVSHVGVKPNLDLIAAELRSRMAGYKVPRQFLVLPQLPKTAAGKVDRREIRRLWNERSHS